MCECVYCWIIIFHQDLEFRQIVFYRWKGIPLHRLNFASIMMFESSFSQWRGPYHTRMIQDSQTQETTQSLSIQGNSGVRWLLLLPLLLLLWPSFTSQWISLVYVFAPRQTQHQAFQPSSVKQFDGILWPLEQSIRNSLGGLPNHGSHMIRVGENPISLWTCAAKFL